VAPPAPPAPPAPVVAGPPPHTPFEQVWPVEHAWSQAPQLAVLVLVSMHAEPHNVKPTAQVALHVPALQTWGAWQTVVQLPQCAASDATHAPLHRRSPDWQAHEPL